MAHFRFLFSFGFFIISFSVNTLRAETPDSLEVVVSEVIQDSLAADKNALVAIKKLLLQAKKDRNDEDIIYAYQQLAALNYRLGNTSKALHYYKLYVIELEQLSDFESNKQQRFEKNLYENEINALSIKIKNLEANETALILQHDEFLENNYWVYLGLRAMLAIAAVLILGWLYNRYKKPKKKKENITKTSSSPSLMDIVSLTKDQLATAETELDLSDILVQEIITSPEDSFSKNKTIRKKFLLHQPRKMAGGDGLYITTEKYKTLIVVYDTPGFGAAGGLLNTRIYNLLEKLVKEHKIISPNLILNQLEINILNLFPAGVPFTGGINMAICLYNSTEKSITYSGANMDLFIVRRGLLNKLPGASKSLVDNQDPIEYINTVIDITRGINIYISTKGYWLQQGGHESKPFGKAAFEKAIESLSSQPIIDHEKVLNKILNDWKGGNEQDDDVLVLGLGF